MIKVKVKVWEEQFQTYKAPKEMILEKFLIQEVRIPLREIRKIRIIRDRSEKCELGKSLMKNNIKEGSRIEIKHEERKGKI